MAKAQNREAKPQPAQPPASAPSEPDAPHSSLPVILRWFLSKTVRQARRDAQARPEDSQPPARYPFPQAIEAGRDGDAPVARQAVAEGADKPALEKQMENLEKAANKWLKPYPNAAWRENVEVLLVALTVAMGIRTFFLQPFKIPPARCSPPCSASPQRT